MDPDAEVGAAMAAILSEAEDVETLLDEADGLPYDDVAGRTELAERMQEHVAIIAAEAETLLAAAAAADDVALPDSGEDGRGSYDVQIEVDNMPAIADLEFRIMDTSPGAVVGVGDPQAKATQQAAATQQRSGGSGTTRQQVTVTPAPAGAASAPGAAATTSTGRSADRNAAPTRSSTGQVSMAQPPASAGNPAAAPAGDLDRDGNVTDLDAPPESLAASGASSAPGAPGGGDPSVVNPYAPAAAPTWTVPVPGGGAAVDSGSPSDDPAAEDTGREGPDPLVLLVGVLALGGLAAWMRARY
jgi:hypothetical protein